MLNGFMRTVLLFLLFLGSAFSEEFGSSVRIRPTTAVERTAALYIDRDYQRFEQGWDNFDGDETEEVDTQIHFIYCYWRDVHLSEKEASEYIEGIMGGVLILLKNSKYYESRMKNPAFVNLKKEGPFTPIIFGHGKHRREITTLNEYLNVVEGFNAFAEKLIVKMEEYRKDR